MRDLFHPQSIAIVGASQDFDSIGGKPLKNLIRHRFKGEIYPINPKYEAIAGYRCYPSLLDLPTVPDVVMIAVSKSLTLKIIRECAEKNVRQVIIFSSGFAEAGEDGKRLEQEMLKLARENGIRIVGPNCLGCLNVKDGIPMGFATSLETEKPFVGGPVGLVSQSGAFGFSVFGLAQEEHIGFSYIANTGNQIDVHTIDMMSYMMEDDDTTVIAGYLESIPDGEMLLNLSRRAAQLKKPLILLKAGQSELGQKSALSHTASVAGSAAAFRAAAHQFGMIQVNDMDDMIDAIKVFARGKYAAGTRVAALSNSGAAGITVADYCETLGLDMVTLSEETTRKIESIIPSFGSAVNPIDITAQALMEEHLIKDALQVLLDDDQVDMILLQTTFSSRLVQDIFADIVQLDRQSGKPIVVVHTGTTEIVGEARSELQKAGIPVYQTCYRALVAMRHLARFSRYCEKRRVLPDQSADLPEIRDSADPIWMEDTVKEYISSMGIRVPRGSLFRDPRDLAKIKGQIRFPAVAKIVSPDIPHKTEAGAVRIGLNDERALEEAVMEMYASVRRHVPNARIKGVLIEEMVSEPGVEMFIGLIDDPQFGPFIACGLGGIFLEVFKDRSLRVAPVDLPEAHEMLRELKGYPLLSGVRGRKILDVDAMAEALVQMSKLAHRHRGRIAEMDLNPVMVLEKGAGIVVLDGLMVWKSSNQTGGEEHVMASGS